MNDFDGFLGYVHVDEKPKEKPKEKEDNVNHPQHYISPSGIESIDVIAAFTRDLRGDDAFCSGNAIKYLLRWPYKNGIEDLEKARWYITRIIDKYNEGEQKDEVK